MLQLAPPPRRRRRPAGRRRRRQARGRDQARPATRPPCLGRARLLLRQGLELGPGLGLQMKSARRQSGCNRSCCAWQGRQVQRLGQGPLRRRRRRPRARNPLRAQHLRWLKQEQEQELQQQDRRRVLQVPVLVRRSSARVVGCRAAGAKASREAPRPLARPPRRRCFGAAAAVPCSTARGNARSSTGASTSWRAGEVRLEWRRALEAVPIVCMRICLGVSPSTATYYLHTNCYSALGMVLKRQLSDVAAFHAVDWTGCPNV